MQTVTRENVRALVRANWKPGLTVAFISIPLSIALSIASGAGPLPGLITGIWGTLIGSMFIGSNFNIIGAAGALSTVLFAATLTAPLGLGASILPILALCTGILIFIAWLLKLDRYLYYIPTNVMHGFATGVAILIAASQLFDATGLSHLTRTGHFLGDIEKFITHHTEVHLASLITFLITFGCILVWKRYNKKIPAVIPVAIFGIIFGYIEATYTSLHLTSLQDKFGHISATITLPVEWTALFTLSSSYALFTTIISISSLIALIAILETLITAKLGDKLTKIESSSSRELLGLALANLASGVTGGLPATGVFIRTGANITAGATHRTSGVIAAGATGFIALLVLPYFSYIPMVVIAAILVNTALGLLGFHELKKYWRYERESFFIAVLVATITIFHDAGLAVGIGATAALLLFVQKISHGRFDIIWNYQDGTTERFHGIRQLHVPNKQSSLQFVTYSIAGDVGYLDANRHYHNLKALTKTLPPVVIVRFRNLFSIDYEGVEALADAVTELQQAGVTTIISSVSPAIKEKLLVFPIFASLATTDGFTKKTSDAILRITTSSS